ncbi:MAG: hypothetical protein NWF04_10065 [Candidatus Bathyarchaeota archaeon]|nr:hypothetical protein [Candidatus Bathyarchaeota archaeon]
MQRDIDSALSSEACSHLQRIGKADILVGIPSYNNVLTASYVISQVIIGLETYFPQMSSVIFVSDGNSVDGTLTSVKTVNFPSQGQPFNLNLVPAVYVGISGKGTAIKAVFEAAKFLGVKAVALVDSDLRSITPEWMNLLLSPVMSNDTGLVVPFYNRRKYDGTITNFLCYPVTASLYGKNIRQPIGGDFGLSMELVDKLLKSPLWKIREVRSFGIDIFETHTALAEGFKIKQAFLGIKDHDAKDPTKHLAPMFRQVVGTMFTCLEQYEAVWKKAKGYSEVEGVGEEKYVNSQKPIPIDLPNMINTYRSNFNEYLPTYKTILEPEDLEVFEHLKDLETMSAYSFPRELWAKTVYDFITAFHKAPKEKREILIDALRILWTGRLAAFIKETADFDPEKTEEEITKQAEAFKKLKPHLIETF